MSKKENPIKLDYKFAAYLSLFGIDSTKNVVINNCKIDFIDDIKRLEDEIEGTTGVERRRIYQRLWRLKKKEKEKEKIQCKKVVNLEGDTKGGDTITETEDSFIIIEGVFVT